jgi:threonyl-tRNA synthetase
MRALGSVVKRLMAGVSEQEGRRITAASGPQVLTTGKIGGEFQIGADPAFIQERARLFDAFWARQLEATSLKPKETIVITLPNGSSKEGVSWQTTPLDVAKMISSRLANEALVAKVKYTRKVGEAEELVSADKHDGEDFLSTDAHFQLLDLNLPLEGDCEISILTFNDPEGKATFWHSSAHVLGASLELRFGSYLTIGPPINPGFFYDCYLGQNTLSQENFKEINDQALKVISANHQFQRVVIDKEEALQLFSYNPFKVQLISNKIPEGGKTTAYRCGPLIDLCTGPHLPFTKKIKAFSVTKNSSASWLGNTENDSLQRIYGVSFPSKTELDEYFHLLAEAERRDHRNVGKQQDLFFWHVFSPGSTFFLPSGARIYNRLCDFIRKQYLARGFTEVLSPNVYNSDLWKISGHYQNYKDDMFMFNVENQEFGIKPMNCPGHCLMFDHSLKSYRDLPIRYADFGVLHRNEASGALTGLTRVRRFQQDDAHIFCRRDQILSEVMSALDFLSYVYDSFGFKYEFELSTRPEKSLGNPALWEMAEAQLAQALDSFGKPWKLNPGDGAFYGPKIDIKVFDALKRKHQCGTIQLDFNLPIRFNLFFKSEDSALHHPEEPVAYGDFVEKPLKTGFERPVIIHRAVLGSVERMTAILVEHTGGRWPLWLSPRQVVILNVADKYNDYAEAVKIRLEREGFYADTDDSNQTIKKKVAKAQVAQYNYICVVGADEESTGTVDVRDRDTNASLGKLTIESFVELLHSKSPRPSQAELDLDARAFRGDFVEIKRQVNLKEVDSTLSLSTFVEGEVISEKDWELFSALHSQPDASRLPHLSRWYSHLRSLRA